MQNFPDLLTGALSRMHMRQVTFAKLAGVTQGYLSNVITGKRLPPLDKLAGWAEILQLDPDQRAQFIEVGQLAHAPPDIQAEFLRLAQKQRPKKQ